MSASLAQVIIYRSARATGPHLGLRSFWTPNCGHAQWFAAWEARTLPDRGPSCIYRAEIAREASVLDLRQPVGCVKPDVVCPRADEIAEAGYEWALVMEGPIEGSWWAEAIYLGAGVVPAERLEC
jgi:hypothetical protein